MAKTPTKTRRPATPRAGRRDPLTEDLQRCLYVAHALTGMLADVLEDQIDIKEARAALRERGRRIPFAELKKTLGASRRHRSTACRTQRLRNGRPRTSRGRAP